MFSALYAKYNTSLIFFLIFLVGLSLHALGKEWGVANIGSDNRTYITGPTALIVQQALAGPCLGLGADANILSVFTVYAELKDHLDLADDDEQRLWLYIYQHLKHAQTFDPWFWDINRLSSGLLMNQKRFQKRAVGLLQRGSNARTWDWETPFVAGFMAHDLLGDDVLALSLTKEASYRPGAPSIVISFSAKLMEKNIGIKDSIDFLRAMKKLMPKLYSDEINAKILALEKKQTNSY
ncbi:MAG: hypothetical protein Q9M22_04700 [Mariprofundaceae bacterium]|nr:hypothetical protein [Mariprofundaceae bacterium]